MKMRLCLLLFMMAAAALAVADLNIGKKPAAKITVPLGNSQDTVLDVDVTMNIDTSDSDSKNPLQNKQKICKNSGICESNEECCSNKCRPVWGVAAKIKTCIHPDKADVQTRQTSALHKVDWTWESWTEWSACTVNCGEGLGYVRRQRTCQDGFGGGEKCPKEREVESRECNLEERCPETGCIKGGSMLGCKSDGDCCDPTDPDKTAICLNIPSEIGEKKGDKCVVKLKKKECVQHYGDCNHDADCCYPDNLDEKSPFKCRQLLFGSYGYGRQCCCPCSGTYCTFCCTSAPKQVL